MGVTMGVLCAAKWIGGERVSRGGDQTVRLGSGRDLLGRMLGVMVIGFLGGSWLYTLR